MTKHSRRSQPSDGGQPSDPGYAVGYCRPPVHRQVKPGQVLNPRGRPKGQRNVAIVLTKALNARTKIREGNRTRTVTKLDYLILKMIADAAAGNAKAQANIIGLMRAVGLVEKPTDPSLQEALTPDDPAVIAEFLKRLARRPLTDSDHHPNSGIETGNNRDTKS